MSKRPTVDNSLARIKWTRYDGNSCGHAQSESPFVIGKERDLLAGNKRIFVSSDVLGMQGKSPR